MKKLKTYPLEILLLESCEKNIGLVKKLLNSTKIKYKLHIVSDTNETYAFLQKEGIHSNAPIPDAILHSTEPASDFEKKIAGFLDTQVLLLKITDDKIEITKSNKHTIEQTASNRGITHILEAIVSVKKFMGSLIVPTEHANKDK